MYYLLFALGRDVGIEDDDAELAPSVGFEDVGMVEEELALSSRYSSAENQSNKKM